MRVTKNVTVSIVIPVYNEADQLDACLQAVARQTVTPDEVIVVDNNSTDDSLAIACSFSFVRVIKENRQGVAYARDCGFDAVKSDIIARIDADTIIAQNWVETLQQLFKDQQLDVVTGKMTYHDVAAASLVNAVDLVIRRWMAKVLAKDIAVQGANMALRRNVWRSIRTEMCHERGIHEDYDIAIHARKHNYSVQFDERLLVSIGYRQAAGGFRQFMSYALASPHTYARHDVRSGRHMYKVIVLLVVLYLPIKFVKLGYSRDTNRFAWHQLLFGDSQYRVNPATYID